MEKKKQQENRRTEILLKMPGPRPALRVSIFRMLISEINKIIFYVMCNELEPLLFMTP